jgi:hypothetical protein
MTEDFFFLAGCFWCLGVIVRYYFDQGFLHEDIQAIVSRLNKLRGKHERSF